MITSKRIVLLLALAACKGGSKEKAAPEPGPADAAGVKTAASDS